MDLKELKELEAKISDMAGQVKALEKKRELLHSQHAADQARDLFKYTRDFYKLFNTGVVAKAFNRVNDCLEKLEGFDPGYKGALAGSAYGIESTPATKYLIEFLFCNKWDKTADLWQIMEQISMSIHREGNPFTDKKEK